ncbi:MAG: hypothetical protein IIZ33_01870 [Erysipelotrichaceae bacterium]|nr:hypothetical protein [Erysipelotrichaceae bacterium]
MSKIRGKDLLVSIAGLFIMGFGCGMMVKSGWGADTTNAFFSGISKSTGLSVGSINAIANVIMVIVIYFLEKKYIGISMFLAIFLIKFPVDLAISICPSYQSVLTAGIGLVIALFIVSFGASMMIVSGLGCSPYDGLVLSISGRFHLPYLAVKYAADAVCVLGGWLFHGEVGLGTLLCFLLMGSFISFNRKWMEEKYG